jgi:hypothetical protein
MWQGNIAVAVRGHFGERSPAVSTGLTWAVRVIREDRRTPTDSLVVPSDGDLGVRMSSAENVRRRAAETAYRSRFAELSGDVGESALRAEHARRGDARRMYAEPSGGGSVRTRVRRRSGRWAPRWKQATIPRSGSPARPPYRRQESRAVGLSVASGLALALALFLGRRTLTGRR